MQYGKFTRAEKRDIKSRKTAEVLHGEGVYLYENNTKADLTLPKPTNSGLRTIGPKGSKTAQFRGDNYYMQLVRTGHLRFIQEIQAPTSLTENVKMEEKLILDQPDIVTAKGKVEHVVSTKAKKINEEAKDQEVLLNESPDDGFVIIAE